MEEKYWNKFMLSGRVADYLYYRGIAICGKVMERYGHRRRPDAGMGERFGEPDKGDGDGPVGHAHWRV